MSSRQRKDSRSGGVVPTRAAEIETKLEAGPEVGIPQLRGRKQLVAVGLPEVGPAVDLHLDALYFDTAGLDLLRSRLTLRRRTGGDDAGWHLKLPGRPGSGRTEVRLPLDSSPTDAVPGVLADLVRGAARGRPLAPVARLENHRVVRRLRDAAGVERIEVADDAVVATSLLPGAGEPKRWRELEVEIIDGTVDQLTATVGVLRNAGATPSSSASKLGRALPDPPVPDWPSRKSAAVPVLTALVRHRDTLLRADRAVREEQPGSVGDFRRAVRRIQSVLQVYAALFDQGASQPVLTGLRRVDRVFGAARDLEVAQHRLDTELADEPEHYAHHAGAVLRAALSWRSAAARAEAAAAIDAPGYFDLLIALDDLLATPTVTKRGTRAATGELPALMRASWESLRTLADDALADPDNDVALHDVRRSAISLRYATEAVASALGDDAVVFAAALEEIQEVLGEHRDAVVAAQLLVDVTAEPATDGTAGFIFGRLHAVEQALAHGSVDDFADAWDRVEDGDLIAALDR